MKKIIFHVLICVISMFISAASAEEQIQEPVTVDNEGMAALEDLHEEYVFPSVKPEILLFGGYRYVHVNGSDRVDEYEYLHNSWVFGGELRAFSFPHRFHLELDVKNSKDFFGDVGYAYEDVVVFRGLTRSLWHNLDNLLLKDLDPSTNPITPNPDPFGVNSWVDVRDGGEKYGLRAAISTLALRLKTPSYPFHVYFEGIQVSRDGEQQQRSLLGGAYFNDIGRTSQKRDVDNHARTMTAGLNSHLGPIEMDYSHSEKRFTVDGDNVLYDQYGNAGFPPGSTRIGGVYPHNLIPELKSSTDTFKVHTSYTGALVASATFTKTDKENRDSGAKASYFTGTGEVSYIASRDLAFFAKYRQAESSADTPDSVEFADVCTASLNSTGNYKCAIKESISKIVRTATVAARYRLTSGIVIKGEYAHETIDRQDADLWQMPDESEKNTVTLSSDIRLLKQLKMNLKYIHKSIQNPAVNIEPNQANEGQVSVTWTPLKWLTALASYRLTSEHRDNLLFLTEEGNPVDSPGDRKQRRERFLGSVSILPVKDLVATLSFFYLHDRQKEDLAYSDPVPVLLFDSGVVNQNTVRNVAFDLQYLLSKQVTLNAGVSNTQSKGKFHPSDPNLLSPASIASYSELEMRETLYTLGAQFDLKGGFSLGMHYKYSRMKDLVDNPYDDIDNGEAHIAVFSLTKRW